MRLFLPSLRTETDEGCAEMAQQMEEAAREQPGYLGMESARSGLGITVSYWETPEAIRQWKAETSHRLAQTLWPRKMVQCLPREVCRVEREYGFDFDLRFLIYDLADASAKVPLM